jgi:hypothetical protein
MNLVENIATGVATAFARVENSKAMNEQQKAVENQNKPSAVEQKLDAVNANLVKSNAQNASNIESIQSLFSEADKMLAQMSLPKDDNKASAPSAAAVMNSMAANDMSLSANGAGVSGGMLGQLKSFFTSSAPTTQLAPDANGQVNQQVGTDLPKNDAASDRKALLEEEDRAYKAAVRPVMPKLSQALDKFLDGSAGLGGGNSADSGNSLMNLLTALAAGSAGFVIGYLGKLGEMWGNVGKSFASGFKAGLDKLKNSKIGKTIGNIGTKLKSALSGGIQKVSQLGKKLSSVFTGGMSKIGELKSSFTGLLNSWKTSLKESSIGKAAGKVADTAKSVGGFFKSIATKMGNTISGAAKSAGSAIKTAGKSVAAGSKMAARFVANSGIVKTAVSAAKTGAKIAKKFPAIQAAAGLADTAVNTYKAVKAGAGVTDVMTTVGAGLIDTLSDTLLIPEIMNGIEGGVNAAINGEGLAGVLKGAGSGFIKQRDANEISVGNGMMANIQNFMGNETETTRRVAEAYNSGKGYDAAGLQTVSGAAGGFGHSVALYRPKAAGSLENNRTPNATVTDNLPTNGPMSEADKAQAYADKMEEGLKKALLSPEVQEANARNAQATGTAINGSLFGG